jgi:hypothetical protein
MGWYYVPNPRAPKGLLFILQVINACGEQRWNDTDSENLKNAEETYSSAILSTTNPTLASAVRHRRLTAWAMARSYSLPLRGIRNITVRKEQVSFLQNSTSCILTNLTLNLEPCDWR